MSKFPAEVLVLIFKHLHFEQKLECMLVCRTWAQILRQGYLFETIHLSYSSSRDFFSQRHLSYSSLGDFFNQRLTALLKKAKSEVFPGRKCKRLLIDSIGYGCINAASLATSFPNLNHFYSRFHVTYTPEGKRLRSATLDPDPFLGWRANLETLIDEGSNGDTLLNILKTGVFSHLTTLKIEQQHPSDKSNMLKWISSLKNTPALTDLSINISTPSLTDLEDLHTNVPELTSLTLEFGLLLITNKEELTNIIPVEKVKVLRLITSGWNVWDSSGAILSYIKSKYTRLNEFSCSKRFQKTSTVISSVFSDSGFAEFITFIGPGLRKYMVSLEHISAVTVDLIGKYMIQLESMGTDIFGCKNMFEKRNMKGSPRDGFFSQQLNSKIIQFKKFIHLKELILDFSNVPDWSKEFYRVTFGDILNELPESIRTLYLKCIYIDVGEDKEPVQDCTNVVNLSLYDADASGNSISSSLTHYFPNLKYLVLDHLTLKNSTMIDLPDHHLQYFEFVPSRVFEFTVSNMFSFTITTPDQKLYYEVPVIYSSIDYLKNKRTMGVGTQDLPMQRLLTVSPETYKNPKTFEFKCASVQTVFCYNHLLIQ